MILHLLKSIHIATAIIVIYAHYDPSRYRELLYMHISILYNKSVYLFIAGESEARSNTLAGIILGMSLANERRRFYVKMSIWPSPSRRATPAMMLVWKNDSTFVEKHIATQCYWCTICPSRRQPSYRMYYRCIINQFIYSLQVSPNAMNGILLGMDPASDRRRVGVKLFLIVPASHAE